MITQPGDNLSVFRLERDVLVRKPDLLFVEFAVNDGDAPNGVSKTRSISAPPDER